MAVLCVVFELGQPERNLELFYRALIELGGIRAGKSIAFLRNDYTPREALARLGSTLRPRDTLLIFVIDPDEPIEAIGESPSLLQWMREDYGDGPAPADPR